MWNYFADSTYKNGSAHPRPHKYIHTHVHNIRLAIYQCNQKIQIKWNNVQNNYTTRFINAFYDPKRREENEKKQFFFI